jgi:hypothetical protein
MPSAPLPPSPLVFLFTLPLSLFFAHTHTQIGSRERFNIFLDEASDGNMGTRDVLWGNFVQACFNRLASSSLQLDRAFEHSTR